MNLFSVLIFYVFLTTNFIDADDGWNSNNYPNPAIDFEKCGMNLASQICDPDSVFSLDDRKTINDKLKWLQTETGKNDTSACSKMGLYAATITAKHFQGGTSDSLKAIANDLISKWSNTNNYCKKFIIIAFASDDQNVWITGDSDTSIKSEQYNEISENQKALFQSGNYTLAILNIVDALKSANQESKRLSTGALIGIILGSIAVILICCCSICIAILKKN